MRYGIFADVHSNLTAFEAVLDVLTKSNIDKFLFLGDIVGYGAQPSECIRLLRELDVTCVAGNHDRAVVDLCDINRFNKSAEKAIIWTKNHIFDAEKLFLFGLRLSEENKVFHLVHGTLDPPEEFDYMSYKYQAMKTFYAMRRKICFVGHSHVQGVFIEEKEDIKYEIASFLSLEQDKRYIVNVGSVGQPRDGDARACSCIYDEGAATIEIKRVAYDIAKAQQGILDAGLPRDLADRLLMGK